MADEYIRKQDAIDDLRTQLMYRMGSDDMKRRLDEWVKTLPSVDVAPVVHSRWEYKCGEIRCPECGNRIHRIDLSGCLNFCPNCGAKMDGEE